MNGYALGLIEVYGLTAAIEAADACVKSANVKLVEVQNATGALMTVKVVGDVGAVKAAVSAGKARAAIVGTVIAVHVIARPAKGLDALSENRQTWTSDDSPVGSEASEPAESSEPVGFSAPAPEQDAAESAPMAEKEEPASNQEPAEQKAPEPAAHPEPAVDSEPTPEPEPTAFPVSEQEASEAPPALPAVPKTTDERKRLIQERAAHRNPTCNICQDPACPRQKGQPAKLCIHHTRK